MVEFVAIVPQADLEEMVIIIVTQKKKGGDISWPVWNIKVVSSCRFFFVFLKSARRFLFSQRGLRTKHCPLLVKTGPTGAAAAKQTAVGSVGSVGSAIRVIFLLFFWLTPVLFQLGKKF